MRTVVAFNLAKVTPRDSGFFTGLAREFVRQDTAFALFTPQRQDNMKSFCKPFDWTIAKIASLYPLDDVVLTQRLSPEQRRKWTTRVAALSLQGEEADPAALVDILERFANYVLTVFRPAVVLSWNTLCPHSGVLAELARPLGIRVYMIERAFLDQTWFLEDGGLVGHSALVEADLETLCEGQEEECRQAGESYLGVDPFHAMARYPQKQGRRFYDILEASRRARRPTLGFLPPDDLSLGFQPTDLEDRKKHLPHYDDSIAAAIALAEAVPHCDVIFKPHPSFREMDLPEKLRGNLYVVDHDYREVIARTDVMVSTGTGLVTNALSSGKPVVQMNRDQFLNKGITYEALTPDAIPGAVEAALAQRDLAERLARFRRFIGWALRCYLVSAPDADSSFRRPADAARDIVAMNFGAPVPALAEPGPATSRSEMFRALRVETDATLLVDLDHTLLFANTTEHFLDNVRPRLLFIAIHWLVSWLTPWAGLAGRGVTRDSVFDPLRVFFCGICAPWSLLLWRWRAPQLVARMGNHALIAGMRSSRAQRIVVVSNGHPWLVRPVVRAMGLPGVQIVCGNIWPGPGDIRRIGKIAALSQQVADLRPGRCIAISDSRDDIQMLTRMRWGYLIDWQDAKTKANPLARYFPFVLTTEGKYPKARVVRRHRFKEDFPVILMAFALAGVGISTLQGIWVDPGLLPDLLMGIVVKAAALFALFLSFNAVYEIGYWDNDFIAAAGEAQPNVSPAMEQFRDYPIRRGAWGWGIVCGALGTLLIAGAGLGGPLLVRIPATGTVGGDQLVVWAVSLGLWLGGLWLSRRVFDLHNTLPEPARIYSFYLLHVLKLLIYALLLPVALAGLVLIMAQVYRHWLGYAVYRFAGRKDDVPRMQLRGFFFLAITAILACAMPAVALFDVTWICGALFLLLGRDGFRWPRRHKGQAA